MYTSCYEDLLAPFGNVRMKTIIGVCGPSFIYLLCLEFRKQQMDKEKEQLQCGVRSFVLASVQNFHILALEENFVRVSGRVLFPCQQNSVDIPGLQRKPQNGEGIRSFSCSNRRREFRQQGSQVSCFKQWLQINGILDF